MLSTSARPPERITLRELGAHGAGLRLDAPGFSLSHGELTGETILGGRRPELLGKSVAIAARAQIDCARALVELDGLARRLVIIPPDFTQERLRSACVQAEVDALVVDARGYPEIGCACHAIRPAQPCAAADPSLRVETEWVMPTSGTSGPPKLVVHSLAALLGAMWRGDRPEPAPVWATFYDIRRYGGLQILLRALAQGTRLVLSDADEGAADFLLRCRAAGVTHISGTPSHWRRLLMRADAGALDPAYVRLSGEIADRAILDALRAAFPRARIVHAYASTEAGVVFEVADGREGFPASLLENNGGAELRLKGDSLQVRSKRAATRYIGQGDLTLRDDEGFVDTGDMVERIGERCYFRGRRSGVINIGGLKAHPEEIEEVLNAHDKVRLSRVSARRNPLMGALVVAEIVLCDEEAQEDAVKDDILRYCRERLPPHKAPVTIKFVDRLEMSASGKLARGHA